MDWTGSDAAVIRAVVIQMMKMESTIHSTWRGWQDFGTGALGDMACHTVNMPFRALNLGYPTEIEAIPFGQMNKESYPVGSKDSLSISRTENFYFRRSIRIFSTITERSSRMR